jgi:hypothetical protein
MTEPASSNPTNAEEHITNAYTLDSIECGHSWTEKKKRERLEAFPLSFGLNTVLGG